MRPAKIFLLLIIAAVIGTIYFANGEPVLLTTASPSPSTQSANPHPLCNPSLWDHIWNPWRLKVSQDCKTVTGTIIQKFLAEDGDYHLLLEPDDKSLGKTLVVEIICAGKIDPEVKVAQKACAGYINKIPIPDINDHLQITGSYVWDTSHNWSEIHPVSALTKI